MKKIFPIIFLMLTEAMVGDNLDMGIKKNSDGTYSILNNDIELKINPKVGGRITSFMLDGQELILQKENNESSYGSTLWPSPQSLWNWPPISALDGNEYSIKEEDSKIILTSSIDPKTGLCFEKIITGPVKKDAVELPFVITNEGSSDISVAPWQITRVQKGGLLFFPMGQGKIKAKSFDLAPTKEINNIVWYESRKEEPLNNHQLNIADGSEGWLAYAAGKKLFVKKFTDIKPEQFAPGEAEILFYVDRQADFIEIEVQGPYKKLAPSSSLEWTVEWYAFEIPADIKVETGSEELVEFVRSKIK